ncbi:hypothetical protein OG912_37935 (plasmid) [Streptomyces sp. NBC_00464]
MTEIVAGCAALLFARFAVSYAWARIRSLLCSGAVLVGAVSLWQMVGGLR